MCSRPHAGQPAPLPICLDTQRHVIHGLFGCQRVTNLRPEAPQHVFAPKAEALTPS